MLVLKGSVFSQTDPVHHLVMDATCFVTIQSTVGISFSKIEIQRMAQRSHCMLIEYIKSFYYLHFLGFMILPN